MLKHKLTRYKNYGIDFHNERSIVSNKKKIKYMKYFYKHLFINSVFLKKQQIMKYSCLLFSKSNHFFMGQIMLFQSEKINPQNIFIWSNHRTVSKTKNTYLIYRSFLDLFFPIFLKSPLYNFHYYWLSAFLKPSIRTQFYCFTNNIRFFLNQRLIKQPVLLLYSTIDKNNFYSNYLKIFKGLILKKNLNSLFLMRSVLFQIYPKFHTKSYFFRHNSFIKKFINNTYLKLMLT